MNLAASALGDELAGVHSFLGIPNEFESLHEFEVALAKHEAHLLTLFESDTVLAGQASARFDTQVHDAATRFEYALDFLGVAAIIGDVRVKVSIARVKHV